MSPYLTENIIGSSPPMERLRRVVASVAGTLLPVLIEGPTGAGKELVATAVHLSSGRPGRLVAFNACAIGDSMFEDTLFGHVRGAFTGAVNDSPGLLREADRGTAFFDEISGLAVGLQAKLLRAIETGEFRPVGGRHDVRSEFRVVSATNEALDTLVAAHRFRADLAHRIGAVVVRVPSLAERVDDIPLLVRHFLDRCGHAAVEPERAAIAVMRRYAWPGNIRELRQVIEWAVIVGDGRLTADAVDSVLAERTAGARVETLRLPANADLARERDTLRCLLERHSWDTESAAREAGIHRATLYRRMKRVGVRPIPDDTDEPCPPTAWTESA